MKPQAITFYKMRVVHEHYKKVIPLSCGLSSTAMVSGLEDATSDFASVGVASVLASVAVTVAVGGSSTTFSSAAFFAPLSTARFFIIAAAILDDFFTAARAGDFLSSIILALVALPLFDTFDDILLGALNSLGSYCREAHL